MNNKNSNFLFIFIGLFLVAAFISGCGTNTTNTNKSNSTNRASNAANYAQVYASAPAGASPAHFKGGQAAAVTIEEFADYQCPTCALMYPTVQQLQVAYGDRLKIIFRNNPLLQVHPKAYDAAVAAEAAGMQNKFWEMQHQLFTNQQSWSIAADHRKVFEDTAQKIGLDVEKFRNDVAGMAAKSRVDADMQRARALGVNSTPTFFINGRPLTYEETKDFNLFRQVIDVELQKTQSGNQSAPTAPVANTSPAAANTNGGNTTAGNTNTAGANK